MMRVSSFVILGIVMVAMLLVLTACRPKEVELLFDTMAQRAVINYRQEKPTLFAIAKVEDVDELVPNVLAEDPTLVDQLRSLDYNHFFAILALQGLHGSGGYQITVQRISRQADTVFVWARFAEPAPDDFRTWGFTSPYHRVVVSKEASWRRSIRFVLMKDDQAVAETTRFIPQ